MRVAVIAGSIAVGLRIVREIESLRGVEVFCDCLQRGEEAGPAATDAGACGPGKIARTRDTGQIVALRTLT